MIVLSVVGEEHILDVVLPGDTFGEWRVGGNTLHVATAQALSNVTVQTMSQTGCQELLQTRPHICHTFVHHVIERQWGLWTHLCIDDLIGADVHFCAMCDGPFPEGQHVAVIGGGNSAGEESLFLTRFARTVILLVRTPTMTASKLVAHKVAETSAIDVCYTMDV